MRRLWSRLHSALRRWRRPDRVERTLDEELRSYLEHDIDARVAAGLPPGEARRTALAALGGVEPIKERVRDARAGAWVDGLRQDLRSTARSIRRAPGVSAAIVASLTVGIAATVAAFAVINATMLRPFSGIINQQQVVELAPGQPCGDLGIRCDVRLTRDDFNDIRRALGGAGDVAATAYLKVSAGFPQPQSVPGQFVSSNYFTLLGTRPAVGRLLGPGDATSLVVVLSHAAWTREYAADPSVVGRSIRIADQLAVVVGVAERGFTGTMRRMGVDMPQVWLPLAMVDVAAPESIGFAAQPRISLLGRLASGRTEPAIASAATRAVANLPRLQNSRPETIQVEARRLGPYDASQRAAISALLLSVPILVLVVGCLNAAMLLLARGSARAWELAIRLALGASRGRLIRQFLTETLGLTTLAAAAGVVGAWWLLLVAEAQLRMPVPIDGTVLVVAAATAVVTALAAGLVPALRITALAPYRGLGQSRTGADGALAHAKGRRRLVVAQVALAIGVLVAALQGKVSLDALGGSAGTPADRLLMASFDLEQLKYGPDDAEGFYRRVLEAIAHAPGVEQVGIGRETTLWTFGHGKSGASLVVWPAEKNVTEGQVIAGGYAGGNLLETVGLAVLEGRGFVPDDRVAEPRVAIVNETFAEDELEGHAIGRTLRVVPYVQGARRPDGELLADSRLVTVVGVIESAAEPRYTLDGRDVAKIYVPSPLGPEPALTVYARTSRSAHAKIAEIRTLIQRINPAVPILEIGSLARFNERSMAPVPWLTRMASALGLVALLLAAAGLYALMAYAVGLRSREFAVRLALGARPGGLLAMVLRQGLKLAAVGLVVGGGLAMIAVPMLQEERVRGLDIVALVQAIAVLIVVMLAASVHPALRASRVDPVTHLKEV